MSNKYKINGLPSSKSVFAFLFSFVGLAVIMASAFVMSYITMQFLIIGEPVFAVLMGIISAIVVNACIFVFVAAMVKQNKYI